MSERVTVIVSGVVDLTIQEDHPDTDFLIFRSINDLARYVETDTIRATSMYITKDVIGIPNTSFTMLMEITKENAFFKADRIVYITEPNSPELKAFNYLKNEYELTNWELSTGPLTRMHIASVIAGTAQTDNFSIRRRAVFRRPKSEYIKQQLRENPTLERDYVDDDTYLKDIPDIDIPDVSYAESSRILKQFYIAGDSLEERTTFALLAAQYLSAKGKTLIVESDVGYHLLTEMVTKSGLECKLIKIDELMNDFHKTLDLIKESAEKLIIIGAIRRVNYDYTYINQLLRYNLEDNIDYMIIESGLDAMPLDSPVTIVMPSNVIGCLKMTASLDTSLKEHYNYVAVNLQAIPEIQIQNSEVISLILRDLLCDTKIECPILTVSSLRLDGSLYDLSAVLPNI